MAAAPKRMLVIDNVAPATRLLEKRRQMIEVQEALAAQKEEFARREEAFRRREESLRRKDLDLQTTLIHFNKTVTHNEAKRLRAENRELQEQKACLDLEETANGLAYKLAEQEAVRDDQRLKLARFVRFNEFMQEVQAESPEEYTDIPAIEHRFSTLQAAIDTAEGEIEEHKRQMAAETTRLSRLRGDLERHKIDLQNDFDLLKQQFDLTKERADELLGAADEAATARGQKLKVFGQVLQTVRHQFHRCMHSVHQRTIKHKATPISDDDLIHGRIDLPDRRRAGGAEGAAAAGEAAAPAGGAKSAVLAEMLGGGRRQVRAGVPPTEEELQRVADFCRLKEEVVTAMQQLEVVGAYTFDLQQLARGWDGEEGAAWRRESASRGHPAAAHATGAAFPTRSPGPASAPVEGTGSLAASAVGRSLGRRGAARAGSGQEWQLARPGIGDSVGMGGVSRSTVQG